MQRELAVLTDVKDIGELLSGASLDATRIAPRHGWLRLELLLTRAMPERATMARRGFLRRAKTPWTKSRVVFEQVTAASVERVGDGGAEQTPLLVCDAVPGGYALTVTSPDGLRWSLAMDQLSGRFEDIGQPLEAP